MINLGEFCCKGCCQLFRPFLRCISLLSVQNTTHHISKKFGMDAYLFDIATPLGCRGVGDAIV